MKFKIKLNVKEIYVKQLLNENSFISVVSYSNFDSIQRFDLKNSLRKLGFKTKFIQNKRLKNALLGSKYDNINHAFQGKIVLIYPQSDKSLLKQKDLIKFINSSSQMFLLGCLVDGQYFQTPLMIKKLQELPDLFENLSGVYQHIGKPSITCVELFKHDSKKLKGFLTCNSISLLNSLNSKI